MIKIENTEIVGWETAIRGMRNPMNSWEKSDSYFIDRDGDMYDILGNHSPFYGDDNGNGDFIGKNDLDLMTQLRDAGTDHRKFMRMITVYVDITAPLYWHKEFDTYKVGTVANSCSTMHKIADKEFTLEDFSCEHLIDSVPEESFDLDVPNGISVCIDDDGDTGCLAVVCHGNYHKGHSYTDMFYISQKDILDMFVIPVLNTNRNAYLKTKDKKYWWQMIQLLPSSYNQKRTVMLNYEVLANIYKSRKNHKLDEWIEFCKWIESLPVSELITGKDENIIFERR